MGDGTMHWWTTLAKYPGVTMYQARHEGASLSMASGWSRVTGQPGVCSVTMGPGVTQVATSLMVANRAQTPVVIFAAQSQHGNQVFNQQKYFEGMDTGFVDLA